MDWGNSGWGAGDWVAMTAVMGIFWGAIVAVVVWAVRGSRQGPARHGDAAGRAETLLAERFARGEIDGEEFSRDRDLLHARGSARSGT